MSSTALPQGPGHAGVGLPHRDHCVAGVGFSHWTAPPEVSDYMVAAFTPDSSYLDTMPTDF